MNIIFRVDASLTIGIGHAMRCLVIAQKYKDNGDKVIFFCRYMMPHLITMIESNGYHYNVLSSDATAEQDATQTIAAIQKLNLKVDLLILDSYVLGMEWEQQITAVVNRMVVIDDGPNRDHYCHLLIDQTTGRKATEYKTRVPPACITLTGPHYALLRPEFKALRALSLLRRKSLSAVRKVLINFGGGDSGAIVLTVLEAIENSAINPEMEITVILNNTSKDYGRVKSLLAQSKRTIHLLSNITNMAELLANSDVVIGAGGTSSYERCCLGMPALVIVCADNQQENAAALEQYGAIIVLGKADSIRAETLLEKLLTIFSNSELLIKISQRAAELCDGMGADRIFRLIKPQLAKDGGLVTVKAVTELDIDQLYGWQQHPATRMFSRDKSVPEYAEHVAWVKTQINNDDVRFYLLVHQGVSAGAIRLARLNAEDWQSIPISTAPTESYEISIYMDPQKYRLGLGKIALELAESLVPGTTIKAFVMRDNIASNNLFIKAGYQALADEIYIRQVDSRGAYNE